MKITTEFALKTVKSTNTTQNSRPEPKPKPRPRPEQRRVDVPAWLEAEIVAGLGLFKTAGIKPFGGSDIKSLAAAWSSIFQDEIGFPIREIDGLRIAQAFKKAAARMDRWPAPGQVLALMPPRPARRALDNLPEPNPARDRAAIKNILTMLEGGKKQ